MAITSFKPEMWAPVILGALEQKLVLGALVNRDYQGEITQAGDTVHINAIGDPTIAAYTAGSTTIAAETLTTADTSLLIDQSPYFAFKVDDFDAAQVAGNVVPKAMERAAWGLANNADEYLAALYTDAATANKLGTIGITSSDLAYQKLIALKVLLDANDCPDDGQRWVCVPPWYQGLLLDNNKFVANPQLGQGGAILNGHVGQAAGFNVYVSNNMVLVTGDDYEVFAGHPSAITFAAQLDKVEVLRHPTAFADIVRGLYVYGAKVVRPTALATMVASIT